MCVPLTHVRLVDFNMSELLDPAMETETSVESLKMHLIMIQYALVSYGRVLSAAECI